MNFLYSPYSLALAAAAIALGILAVYVWRRRTAPGGIFFSLLLVAGAVWALSCALEAAAIGLQDKIFFAKFAYFGIVSIPPLWLLFAIGHSQRSRWLSYRRIALLWLIPVIMLALVWTNELHGLVWSGITPASAVPGELLACGHGIGTWACLAYSYVLILAGICLMVRMPAYSLRLSRSRIGVLLLCGLIPLLLSVLYMAGVNPFDGMNMIITAFVIMVLLGVWVLLKQRLFDLLPVARETLISSMADGVLVLDKQDRVVEMNPAAMRLIGAVPAAGQRADALLGRWPDLLACCQGGRETPARVPLAGPECRRWLDTHVSLLCDGRGRPAGRLVVLRDITELVENEEKLKSFNESLKAEIAERRRAEERMAASLQEKEVLLKEIHHRVKNNLQIVSSLLSLQSENIDLLDPARTFRESQDRIRSMALVHEKLYRSGDVARIDFREYVESLTMGLYRSYFPGPGVRIFADIENVSLDIDLAVSCGLIINELVSNSLKYAFPDGRTGEIRVGMVRDWRKFILTVSDSGAGLPPGLDFRNTSSLGLQLVNTLVGQLEGTIELDTARGTRFKITFAEIE
jgi:two-component sensor histidine kinase/PAS domain-containing protein